MGDPVGWIVWAIPACCDLFEERGRSPKKRHFLDTSAGVFYCFAERNGRPARASYEALGGAGVGALAIRAKRKRDQVIENKQSGEMTDFAPPVIPRTYDPAAKRLVSFGEMNPFVFADVPPGRGPKRNGAKSAPPPGSRGERPIRPAAGDDPKCRRKPLESLETDAEIAPPVRNGDSQPGSGAGPT